MQVIWPQTLFILELYSSQVVRYVDIVYAWSGKPTVSRVATGCQLDLLCSLVSLTLCLLEFRHLSQLSSRRFKGHEYGPE